jgi:hypothetical protein
VNCSGRTLLGITRIFCNSGNRTLTLKSLALLFLMVFGKNESLDNALPSPYNRVMKGAPYCLLFLAASLTAQTSDRLASTLMTLKGATSVPSIRQQVVDDVMSLAWKGNQPSRSSVGKFADDLTSTLVGKDLPVTPISQISIFIAEAVHSAVWKDFSFFASLDHLRKALIGLGVMESEAQAVVDSLIDVGFEVRTQRGPYHGPSMFIGPFSR